MSEVLQNQAQSKEACLKKMITLKYAFFDIHYIDAPYCVFQGT